MSNQNKMFDKPERVPTHVLERTSPIGPGEQFIGRCTRCGKEGLTWQDQGKVPCIKPDDDKMDYGDGIERY